MKIGSTVECIKVPVISEPEAESLPFPKKGEACTVAGFVHKYGGVYIELYEYEGQGFKIENFREIEFPPSLMEEVEECLTQTVEA